MALVYELLWYRQFTLFFGGAAPAAAAILVAYLAGLGIGSFVFGRWAGRWRNHWHVYGWLELGIGVGALWVLPLLSWFSRVHAQAASVAAGPEFLLVWQGLLGFAAVAAPTVAMGATLPVLAELLDRQKQHPGRRVGWLYVVNTSGAAVGALAFPFLFLPALGMRNTAFLCAALNFAIAAAAFSFGRQARLIRSGVLNSTKIQFTSQPVPAPLALAFVSGGGTFALQVLWNRAFAQVHENSLGSFAVIVALFIIAIALGAGLARLLLKKRLNMRKAFAAFWMAGGFFILISPAIFLSGSNNLEYLPGFNLRLVLTSVMVILLPVTLLACGMPLLFHQVISESDRSTGDRAGALLAVNITGSTAGALLAGFVLPKTIGMWNALLAVGLVYFACASWILFEQWKSRLIAFGAVSLMGWVALSIDWPRTRIDARTGERLLALTEGTHGIVAVTERAGSRRLKLNNHYVLGGTAALGDERMQAHLPLLLHPAPRTAAFLGYGTGITAGAALFHSGVQATGIELVPEVGLFASRYFADANLGFGVNERTALIIQDARHYLRVGGRKFDVIVGDLVVPWRPGEASLYTGEHFAAAREALNDQGLFCVWVPMFQLDEAQFKIILNTFLAVFDRALVWRGDFSPAEPALALIGFRGRDLDPGTVRARLAEMLPDPSNPHLQFVSTCWMHLIGLIAPENLDPLEQRINSEDLPWLELRPAASENARGTARQFAGRDLQRWELRVREESREHLTALLPAEAFHGWEAGSAMVEFTLSLSDGNHAAARAAQARILQLMGGEAFRAIFGEEP